MTDTLTILKNSKGCAMLPCFLLTLFTGTAMRAQTPIAVYADPAQGLSFGAFYQPASPGTVIIQSDGSRTFEGNIIGASISSATFSPAIFEIEADPGTVVSILYGPEVSLHGSRGGSMTLRVGPADTGTPFTTTAERPLRTQVKIGGRLSVGSASANPSGSYSGTFSITFIQE